VFPDAVQQYSTDGKERKEIVVRYSKLATWVICEVYDAGGKKRCSTWDGVKANDLLGGEH